jgi:hypothetical protein
MYQIGSYVEYTNDTESKVGIVVEIQPKLNKVLFADGNKHMIKSTNLKRKNISPAISVTYNGTQYLVTPIQNIISMASQSVMKWPENHGVRKAILALVYGHDEMI